MRPRFPTILLILSVACLPACSVEKPLDADALNARGLAATGKGDYEHGIEDYTRAIQLKPDFAAAYRNRGVAYSQKGEYDRAIGDLDQALTLKPDMASGWNSRGLVYQSKGDFERSVKDFDDAIRLRPDNATALKNRGRSQFFQGHFAEAAADLEQGRTYDSTNAYVVIWLYLAKRRMGQDDIKEFASLLARTDTVQWPAPVAKYYLGRLTAEQLVAAATSTASSVQSDQRCAASFYIGEYLLLSRQIPEATRRFEDARANCPAGWTERLGAVAELGRLHAQAGGAVPHKL